MIFPKPITYHFEVTLTTGQDEWWESVEALKTVKERRAEVRAELIRTLQEHGFYEGENATVKSISGRRPIKRARKVREIEPEGTHNGVPK